jgi:L-asparaginase II
MHEGAARAAGTFMPAMNNCSGKHTFMLAASVAQGWSPDYRSPGHPLQVANRATLDEYAGVSHGVGVDGCSIPTFHAPLSAQAFAWEKIAEAMDQHGFFAGADPGRRLGRIGWAMHHHAFFVSGNKRLDLAVVNAASEPLTVKIGAEGLFCIARPNARQGIAIKVHTGVTEALGPAVRAVFAALGVELSGVLPGERVFNVRRALVGERRATFSGGPVASS